MTKDRLFAILECAKNRAQFEEWLPDLINDETTLTRWMVSGKVAELESIYEIRSRRNDLRGEPIKGLKDLVAALNATSDDTVDIALLVSPLTSYAVFVGSSSLDVLAVLKFPVKDSQTVTRMDGDE